MHISGILIRTSPERVPRCVEALAVVHGLEIDRVDEASGSIVVVQETTTRLEQEEALRTIQGLPGVAFAELVCHFVDRGGEDPMEGESAPTETLQADRRVTS